MKQLIGGIAGALITGVAILGWNGPTARSEASWPDSTSRGPVQLVSEQGVTPAAVMESEAAAPALNVTCEPGQRAVVRRVPSAAGMTMEAGCVGETDVATLSGVRGFVPAPPSSAPVPCRWRTRRHASRPFAPCATMTATRRRGGWNRNGRGRSVRW